LPRVGGGKERLVNYEGAVVSAGEGDTPILVDRVERPRSEM
jgi:hypothetical protein